MDAKERNVEYPDVAERMWVNAEEGEELNRKPSIQRNNMKAAERKGGTPWRSNL